MIAKRVSIQHIDLIKEELDVSPLQNIYVQKEVIFPVYSICNDFIYIPKFWEPPKIIKDDVSVIEFKEYNKINRSMSLME